MPGALAEDTKLKSIEDVIIDANGRFKYILCKVFEQGAAPESSTFKHVVRGTAQAEFHSGIYDELDAHLEANGLSCECLGGGKMEHNPVEKSIVVFGTSQGFGRANHSMTVDLLRKKFPDYVNIMWKDD